VSAVIIAVAEIAEQPRCPADFSPPCILSSTTHTLGTGVNVRMCGGSVRCFSPSRSWRTQSLWHCSNSSAKDVDSHMSLRLVIEVCKIVRVCNIGSVGTVTAVVVGAVVASVEFIIDVEEVSGLGCV